MGGVSDATRPRLPSVAAAMVSMTALADAE